MAGKKKLGKKKLWKMDFVKGKTEKRRLHQTQLDKMGMFFKPSKSPPPHKVEVFKTPTKRKRDFKAISKKTVKHRRNLLSLFDEISTKGV